MWQVTLKKLHIISSHEKYVFCKFQVNEIWAKSLRDITPKWDRGRQGRL